MNPLRFSVNTHCQRGHDLRLDGAIALTKNGRRHCRECIRWRNNYKGQRRVECSKHGLRVDDELSWSTKASRWVCGMCHEWTGRRAKAVKDKVSTPRHRADSVAVLVAKIIDLGELREQAATSWERADIASEILEAKQQLAILLRESHGNRSTMGRECY